MERREPGQILWRRKTEAAFVHVPIPKYREGYHVKEGHQLVPIWWRKKEKGKSGASARCGTEGNYLNITKVTYQTGHIILSAQRLKAFPVRLRGTRQGCPLPPPVLNTVLEVLAGAIREKEKKRRPSHKIWSFAALSAADMHLRTSYVENLKEWKQTNKQNYNCWNVTKLQDTKSVVYLTNYEQSEKEVRKFSFMLASKE